MTSVERDTLAWRCAVCEDCQGDNKHPGPATSPLLACQSFPICGTVKVACLQSVTYFPVLTHTNTHQKQAYFFANICLVLIDIAIVMIKQSSIYIL